MKEIKKRSRARMFGSERRERIEALRRVISKYSVLFKDQDRELITDALEVHAALIQMFAEDGKT